MQKIFVSKALGPLLIIVGVVCLGCSSDDPVELPEPRISSLGAVVDVQEYSDGTIIEYTYEEVSFFGDILVSEYEHALSIVEPRYSEGEVLMSVSNSRVFPPSQTGGLDSPADGYVLKTCTADSLVFCDQGKLYIFRKTADGYGLAPVMSWAIIP